MNNDLSQIEFYFPDTAFDSKELMVDKIISIMKEKGSIDYSGYADISLLKKGLLENIGNGDTKKYKAISEDIRKGIEDTISDTIKKCNDRLSVPTKNFVFVHPYFPTQEDVVYEGVMAVAVYSCVFHLFINLEQYTKKSLENTVAHELNHTIYFYHHFTNFNNYTLLDEIILEGLAENFREQYFDSKVTKWANALEKEEALKILRDLDRDLLNSRDQKFIKDFLLGNNIYKRWTGYSVGYWLVKDFISNNPSISWNELVKIESVNFVY